MSAYEMNDQVMGGVMKGMQAAADRFTERMQDIREANVEQKRSQFWHDYAFSLAKQIDDLTDVLNKQNALLAEKEVLLRQATARVETFRTISSRHATYLDLVVKRLANVEDILQRQSANSFALDEFRKLALKELKLNADSIPSELLNDEKRGAMLDEAWNSFMKTTNVKRGIPRPGIDKP